MPQLLKPRQLHLLLLLSLLLLLLLLRRRGCSPLHNF
jgi:hypothetical protein